MCVSKRSRNKEFGERGSRVFTERISKNGLSRSFKRSFGEKKEFYEGTLRLWCQKCLSSEFSKQRPRREDTQRGLGGRALGDRCFEKSREKGLLKEDSRYIPKEVTKK